MLIVEQHEETTSDLISWMMVRKKQMTEIYNSPVTMNGDLASTWRVIKLGRSVRLDARGTQNHISF